MLPWSFSNPWETFDHLKLPPTWHIHNAFDVNLLKPFKGTPSTQPIEEDPPKFGEQEEILQPKIILRHGENLLRSGETLRWYLVTFRNYPPEMHVGCKNPSSKTLWIFLMNINSCMSWINNKPMTFTIATLVYV